MAAALALARAGTAVELLEQAPALSEVGAGLQLGPNAVRVLSHWGLMNDLQVCAAFPTALRVRDAHNAYELGQLRLGPMTWARYGQPYATLHRADLHQMLRQAVQRQGGVREKLDSRVVSFESTPDQVSVTCEDGSSRDAAALIGCDGLWSRVRAQLLGAEPVRSSGHLAYRGLVHKTHMPEGLRESEVTAWLGPRLHVVHYPVRQGNWFNVVAVVHGVLGQGHGGPPGSDPQSWSHEAQAVDLKRAMGKACSKLMAVLDAVPQWTLWALNDRPSLRGAHQQAQGRVALLGDAAHPLRPYLAQGAAMAIEDAWTLGHLREQAGGAVADVDWPALLARYAQTRWVRNARVQERSRRNGTIFHASGPLRWARNMAMTLMGEGLLDLPWLYSGPPVPPDLPGARD
jgi:salicylate hydroxylase